MTESKLITLSLRGLDIDKALSALKGVPKNTESLRVEGFASLGPEAAKHIATHLPGLTTLDLQNNQIGDEGAKHLVQHMPDLKSLHLSFNDIGNDGAAHIARHLTGLTFLDLSSNKIGDEGAAHIARHLSGLTSLTLAGNKVGDEGAAHIARHLTGLTFLDLSDNTIGTKGVVHIAKHLIRLTGLLLHDSTIGPEGAAHIAQHLPELKSLDLAFSAIGNAGAAHIAQHLHHLTFLGLNGNKIGDEGAAHIAQHLHHLTFLDLSDNKIGDEGAAMIAQHLHRLTHLYLSGNKMPLSGNKIGDEGAAKIAQYLHRLTDLHLRYNKIGDEGAAQIAQNLHRLTDLHLGDNKVGDEGAAKIAQHLHHLTFLDLSGNKIGDEGAQKIARGLPSLSGLWLNRNKIKNIPERGSMDIDSLRAHYQIQDAETEIPNLLIRTMLIGEPEVGKSTLFQAIANHPINHSDQVRTHGLKRHSIKESVKHTQIGQHEFILDFWDMGGQSLQHMMHGFFFRSDAIYLLVIDEHSRPETIRSWLDQLKDLDNQGFRKPIVLPVANPKMDRLSAISVEMIEELRRDYPAPFEWRSIVWVNLSAENDPDINELKGELRRILRSVKIERYYSCIDDISKSIADWPEPYLTGSGFRQKLFGDETFIQSFERLQRAITAKNNEILNEKGFADLVMAVLDQVGLIRKLSKPDFVIIDPVWMENGLYSLLPPEDGAPSRSTAAAAFLDKIKAVQPGKSLPGFFSYDDIVPLWREWGIAEAEHEDLLNILSSREMGLVIHNEYDQEGDQYFVPAHLDDVQTVAHSDLLAAIRSNYQTALCCFVFERDYWPPYLIYRHMVYCGIERKPAKGEGSSFHLPDEYKGLSKQQYRLISDSTDDHQIELILLEHRLWCFGHAGNAESLNALQRKMLDIKEDLTLLLPPTIDRRHNQIKTLIPCPICMNEKLLLEEDQEKTKGVHADNGSVKDLNFYSLDVLKEHRSSSRLLKCGDPPYHESKASDILEHLKKVNFSKSSMSLKHAVMVISKFAILSKLASLEGKSLDRIGLSSDSKHPKHKIHSVSPAVLRAILEGEKEDSTMHDKLGGALIERLECLSALTTAPKPVKDIYTPSMTGGSNPVEQISLRTPAVNYLASIALALVNEFDTSFETVSGMMNNGYRIVLYDRSKWKDEYFSFLKEQEISQ